jgi:hypothetical protein
VIRLLFASFVLVAAVFVACGDDDTDDSPTETASFVPPTDTDPAQETVEPTPVVTLNPERLQEVLAEAAEHCPEAELNACSDRYVEFAAGAEPMALCVEGERWFFEPPTGEVGDSCGDDATIVAIVGGS